MYFQESPRVVSKDIAKNLVHLVQKYGERSTRQSGLEKMQKELVSNKVDLRRKNNIT